VLTEGEAGDGGSVAEPEFFKRGGKLLTNTILCRYALEINSKHIY
jgi:hypothetical protein